VQLRSPHEQRALFTEASGEPEKNVEGEDVKLTAWYVKSRGWELSTVWAMLSSLGVHPTIRWFTSCSEFLKHCKQRYGILIFWLVTSYVIWKANFGTSRNLILLSLHRGTWTRSTRYWPGTWGNLSIWEIEGNEETFCRVGSLQGLPGTYRALDRRPGTTEYGGAPRFP
jgi:hypothetical protein